MADFTDRLTDAQALKFINQVNEPFKNLPHLPQGIVDFFVMIVPWLALLGGVLGLIGGVVLALVGGIATLFTLSPIAMITFVLAVILSLIQSVLMLLAFTPLKNRQAKGWIFLFWGEVISAGSLLVTALNGNVSGLVGGVIGLLIGFYIIFEMRASYGPMSAAAKAVKDEVKKLD